MRHSSRAAACLAVVVAVVAACSDNPTSTPRSPEGIDGIEDPVDEKGSGGPVDETGDDSGEATVLKRTTPLDQDESVTRTIGPLGGTIGLPGAGLTLAFPPLALSEPTAITLLAPAGDLVGYHFEPHGLEFQVPVMAVQQLGGTEVPLLGVVLGLGLQAVYFEGDLTPAVQVLETLPLHPVGTGGAGVFHVTHFSGYVIATN